jgi:hypothetical protein
LVAHNLCFFGDLGNLTILDILLKSRRGFNCGLGSKKRKLYFSDVNRILESFGEFPIHCCEKFKPTRFFWETEECKKCLECYHKISDVEGYKINSDDEESPDYEPKIVEAKKPSIFSKVGLKEDINDIGPNLLTKLLTFIKKIKKDYLSPEDKAEVIMIKERKRVEILEMRREIENLKGKMKPLIRLTYKPYLGKLVDEEDGVHIFVIIKRLMEYFSANKSEFKTCANNVKESYSKYISDMNNAAVKKDYLRKVKLMFESKNFKFFEEINIFCKSSYIKSRVEFYNEINDRFNLKKMEYKELKESGKLKESNFSMSDLKSDAELIKSLRAEAENLIACEESELSVFNDEEGLLAPIRYKIYMGCVDKMEENEEEFLKGGLDPPAVLAILGDFLMDLKKRTEKTNEEDIEKLKEAIDAVYSEDKDVFLQAVNETDIDVDGSEASELFFPSYNKIRKLRKDYIMGLDNHLFEFSDLNLNGIEKDSLDEVLPHLVKEFPSYINNKRHLASGTTGLVYESHNRKNFYIKHGIDPNLSEAEWKKECFKVWKKISLDPTTKLYEEKLNVFRSIVGVGPEGIVVGSHSVSSSDYKNTERKPWDLKSFKCEFKYLQSITENVNLAADYTSSLITGAQSDCLYEFGRNNRPVNLNETVKEFNAEINEKISSLKQKIVKIEEDKCLKEVVFDMLDPENQEECTKLNVYRPLNVSKGKRIENEFIKVKSRRSRGKEEFYKTAEKFFLPLKNRYEELEVEESIVFSNETVDKFIGSSVFVHVLTDLEKRRKYRKKKLSTVDLGLKGYERESSFNKFDVENNSNGNKKYDVVNMSVYLKILLAMKILKLNSKKEIYSYFGVKKCQSKYALNSIIKLMYKTRGLIFD